MAQLAESPSLPRDEEGPVFREPWEAQAFGLTVALHKKGLFSWEEWTAQLSMEIARAQRQGDADLGDSYYRHWLAALEALSNRKGLSNSDELASRTRQWREAYLNTPHGRAVELSAGLDGRRGSSED